MLMTKITNFYEQLPASGTVRQMVMLLHGLGSNGQDLMGVAPEFAAALPDAVFISPDAPFAYDMAPGYGGSFQWFSLQSWGLEGMLSGVRTAMPILMDFMDEQLKRHRVPPERLALMGFSQGTMMSLYTAPRYGQRIAGVLGYSGALIGDVDAELAHKIPVHLVHGQADNVVPVMAYHHARGRLEALGFQVSGQTQFGLMHSIDRAGIESGAAFLKSVLA